MSTQVIRKYFIKNYRNKVYFLISPKVYVFCLQHYAWLKSCDQDGSFGTKISESLIVNPVLWVLSSRNTLSVTHSYTASYMSLSLSGLSLYIPYLSHDVPQLFQASATVRHCSTSLKVKIQLDHFCIGDGSYIDVHKFIWASSRLQPKYQGWAMVSKVLKINLKV